MQLLFDLYAQFLTIFPPEIHWLVSLIVLVSLIAAFYVLIRRHWLFLLILILIFPVTIPILKNLFEEGYQFVLYLISLAKSGLS